MSTTLLVFMVAAIAFTEGTAENQEDNLTLIENTFNAAVEAQGDKYFELRERMLLYGKEAIPYLQKASDDERLHARIIARAMLGWAAQPGAKSVWNGSMDTLKDVIGRPTNGEKLAAVVYALSDKDRLNIEASIPFLHVYDMIAYDVTSVMRRRGGFEWTIMDMVPHRIKAMERHDVYLLEAAIKGFPPQWREQVGILSPPDYVNQLARCFAAALSGGCPCKDTPDVLIELLNTDESWVVRIGAAKGLQLLGDNAVAIPHLIKALNDESPEVRLCGFYSLRHLTQDPLGAGKILYHGNEIMPAHIEAAEKWWAENKDRLLEEQKQRQIGD